jgi:hypothetical protein
MKPRSANQCPLVSFRPPSETSQVPSGRVRLLWPRPAEPSTAPPLRFLPLQRFPHTWQRLCCSGLPHLNACASGFSQPPDAFIRPVPAGLVSCRIRSWGSPFRAFLLPRSLPPSPASVPSCRSTNPIPSPTRVAPPRKRSWFVVRHVERFPETSSPSGVCSTRKSATARRLFYGHHERVALLGFCPPGVSPSPERHGFHQCLPSRACSAGRKRPAQRLLRVLIPARLACLSRDRRPSWASSAS